MKKIFAVAIICFITLWATAQETDSDVKQKGFQREKLFFGGNFGLTFGNLTFINVSPQIGYRFTKAFAAGAGINAQYVSYKERYTNGDPYRKVSQGVTGLNMFARVYPFEQFFFQLQPEANYLFGQQKFFATSNREQQTTKIDAVIVPSLLAGGGTALPAGRGVFIVSVFYDVLQKNSSPYGRRPVYNFGYNVGF